MVRRKQGAFRRTLGKVEDELAGIASPMVWLFSSAPESVKNAISALMPALIVLMMFHAMLIAGGGVDGWFHNSLMQSLALVQRVVVVPIS